MPLVISKVESIRYRTGLKIPYSGIYSVRHKQHRLPSEVTLLKDNPFPPCAKCNKPVQFELIMGMAEPEERFGFRVTLHAIPEIEEAAAAAGEEKAG